MAWCCVLLYVVNVIVLQKCMNHHHRHSHFATNTHTHKYIEYSILCLSRCLSGCNSASHEFSWTLLIVWLGTGDRVSAQANACGCVYKFLLLLLFEYYIMLCVRSVSSFIRYIDFSACMRSIFHCNVLRYLFIEYPLIIHSNKPKECRRYTDTHIYMPIRRIVTMYRL